MSEEGIKQLLGKTLTEVKVGEGEINILFTDSDGATYEMYHAQDCCESVTIDDINGDLEDLVGNPILDAREECSDKAMSSFQECMIAAVEKKLDAKFKEDEYSSDSVTWTFYRLATIKGSVVIRWYGSSNGYYSESVDFVKLQGGKDEEVF